MTTAELETSWRQYAVEIDGVLKPLTNHYMMCWGPIRIVPGQECVHAVPERTDPEAPLMFDVGGEQGAPASLFVVENNQLVSVEFQGGGKRVIGKLVRLDAEAGQG